MNDCESRQAELSAAALSRRPPDAALLVHARGCRDCGAHVAMMERLEAELDRSSPALAPEIVQRCRSRAGRSLRAQQLPAGDGFGRSLTAVIVVALLALPLVLAPALTLASWAGSWLGGWLPDFVMTWLSLVYFGSLALGLGLAFGAIPVVLALVRSRAPDAV